MATHFLSSKARMDVHRRDARSETMFSLSYLLFIGFNFQRVDRVIIFPCPYLFFLSIFSIYILYFTFIKALIFSCFSMHILLEWINYEVLQLLSHSVALHVRLTTLVMSFWSSLSSSLCLLLKSYHNKQ